MCDCSKDVAAIEAEQVEKIRRYLAVEWPLEQFQERQRVLTEQTYERPALSGNWFYRNRKTA